MLQANDLIEAEVPAAEVPEIDIDRLTLLLFGHSAFQYLYAGSALGIFEMLSASPGGLRREELALRTGLAPHPLRCLLLGLSALRLIVGVGDRYTNAGLVERMIQSGEWKVVKDTAALEAEIVYLGQADFVESLRCNTNVGLRRIPGNGPDLYYRLAENPDLQRVFYRYMRTWSEMALPLLLRHVPFARWSHILDVGGGDGTNALAIAAANPDASVTLIDLPGNGHIARARVATSGLADRVHVVEADMFVEPFPRGLDCVLFMHQLVIWPLEVIGELLAKAFDALSPGGAVVICSSISNDKGDGPIMAALDSVYFVSIPATRGMIYGWSDYEEALTRCGFARIERYPFNNWTPHGAIVAYKE